MLKRCSNPRSPTFQPGSFNHRIRAPPSYDLCLTTRGRPNIICGFFFNMEPTPVLLVYSLLCSCLILDGEHRYTHLLILYFFQLECNLIRSSRYNEVYFPNVMVWLLFIFNLCLSSVKLTMKKHD